MKAIKILILWVVSVLIWWVSLAQWGWTSGVGWVSLPGAITVWSNAGSGALVETVIQTAVNRVLGILSLIALLILLYAGFLMLTAAGDDEKYKKWFDILKQVALWLAFIGLAWFVVSMIFYLIDVITT